MKIKKLPKGYSANDAIIDEVIRKFSRCPFCGTISDLHRKEYILTRPESIRTILRFPWPGWYKYYFRCRKCDAEWESDLFPQFSDEYYVKSYLANGGKNERNDN